MTVKVGTHQAKSCSNKSPRQITQCVQVGRLVGATRCGDTSQRLIASCVLENFCENRCLLDIILSEQQVAQILSDLILCDLLLRQNYVAETKIFTKILQHTRSDLSQRRVAWCVPTLKEGAQKLHTDDASPVILIGWKFASTNHKHHLPD